MNKSFVILIFLIGFYSCDQPGKEKTQVNMELKKQLLAMKDADQLGARPPGIEFSSVEEWRNFKDSVFRTHQVVIESIYNEYGYPGYDLVETEGEQAFWLMAQHADFDVDFQDAILSALKAEVDKGNANPRHLGLLTDRIRLNRGLEQIYGTQVTYNDLGQAIPKPLEDSASVNFRRKKLGFEPLEEYLNYMTTRHFEMNKENFVKRGITEPILYPIDTIQE